MKRIVLILLLSYAYIAQAQYLAPLDAKNSGARSVGILVADSMQNMRFFDTATCKLAFPSKLAGRIARQSGRLYYNPTGTKFVLLDSVVASSAFDTTNIYAQLALRVKYSDTATMLANYLNIGDIGVSVQGYNAGTTILGNTTSGSGSTILLQGSPTITLPNIAAINVSGGILSLPTGASGTLMRLDDTSTLSARINDKLNIADTTAMLSPYLRKVDTTAMLNPYLRSVLGVKYTDTATMLANYATEQNLADTSATLRALIGGGGVAAASVAEINTGTDNTKFASALGLEGSKYVEQDGTKNYAVTTGTATAYVLATTPSFTPTTGTILYVRFHLANTGAATINVNGSGAVALQKDLSTALVANDIPINIEYTIRRTTTGWLIEDIGFAGINLSARLSGSLSDETGSGAAMFGTTPTVTTSILGSATFSAFNTVTTNLSIAGAATTFTEGGTPTTGLTATYFGNATASGQTKTLNFGTGGASGSTTAINIGSATSGATNNIRMNILPASDATGDIWFRNASGFMTRLGIGTTGQVLTVASGLPSWATAGAGSGWGLTGNAGTNPSTNYVGTSDAQDFVLRGNNVGLLRLTSGFSTVLGEYGTMIGASNTGLGYQTFINGASSFAAGTLAKSVGTSVFSFGWQADNSANHSMLFNCTGSTATNTTANHAKFVVPNGLTIESTAGMFVPPVMTATQAEAIASKPTGGIIYSTTGTGTFITTVGWWGWNGTAWEKLDP